MLGRQKKRLKMLLCKIFYIFLGGEGWVKELGKIENYFQLKILLKNDYHLLLVSLSGEFEMNDATNC